MTRKCQRSFISSIPERSNPNKHAILYCVITIIIALLNGWFAVFP